MIKNYIRKFILSIALITITIKSFSMSIGPIYFNQRIDGSGGYQEYEIDNESFTTRRYKIQVVPITENKKIKEQMEKWLEVYPKILTIPPKSKGTIKVLIKASEDTKIGEYEFLLAPTPITIPTLEKKNTDSKIAVIDVKAPLHFSMVLKGHVGNLGDIYRDVKIEKLKSKDGLKIKITNDMKREVALDILVKENEKVYRDLLKIKPEKAIEKEYKNGEKIEIKEAATEIELKEIS